MINLEKKRFVQITIEMNKRTVTKNKKIQMENSRVLGKKHRELLQL